MCQEIRFPRFKCRIYARNRIKITRVIKLIPPVILLEYTLRGRWRPACVLELARHTISARKGGGPILDQLELEFIAVFEKLSDSCLK